MEKKGLEQSKIGLTAIAHLRDYYNLYYSKKFNYSGVVKRKYQLRKFKQHSQRRKANSDIVF